MMKKIITTLLAMSMVVGANAAMTVVIQDDAGGWQSYEDSTLTITPSTNLVWGVMDDGQTAAGMYTMGIVGPGSITSPTVLSSGVTAFLTDDTATASSYGVDNPYIAMELVQSVVGVLYTSTFHCEGEGDVTLYAFNDNFVVEDTQVIHQVPEPATLAILGIGGLLLRKRRSA